MNKQWTWACVVAAAVLAQGCATPDRRAIPVVDSGAPVSEQSGSQAGRPRQSAPVEPAVGASAEDSGVVVMVPQANQAPLQTFPAPETTFNAPAQPEWSAPAPQPTAPAAPSGIPSAGGGLAADEQLDGPVLALLTSAQQLQGTGDLDGAASSLERAQRIAPREPQVLYRLAQVRLAQGDAAQAEQLSRRALSYAGGRPALQAGLWDLIAQARDRQGDAAGAAQARDRARVNL